MAFTMRVATKADAAALTEVYLDSFTDEIFSRQVYPRDAQSSYTYWFNAMSEELNEPDATFLVVTEPAEGDKPEYIVGFLKWASPDAPVHEGDDGQDIYPKEGLPETAVEFYTKVAAYHRKLLGTTRHWYLDMMGVRRAYTGKGGARQMVEWGLEKAKQDGVPCFTEATGQAKTFYERFGFKTVDFMSIETPQGPAEIYYMIREVE